MEKARTTIIDYDECHFEEKEAKNVEECFPYKDKPTVTWINIDGVHQLEIIEKIGEHFNIHPLVLEDIVNTGQRARFYVSCAHKIKKVGKFHLDTIKRITAL